MTPSTTPRPQLIPTSAAESWLWMRADLGQRLLPFAGAVAVSWLLGRRPAWLGTAGGRRGAQLAFGLAGGSVLFVAAAMVQLGLTRVRGTLKVPASGADAALQGGYYAVNAAVEEAFFRGLVQGGLGALLHPAAGFAAGTGAYVLYHRLGGWAWPDVLATILVGAPLAVAYRLLPGPPSLLGVSLAHFGATCGFLGPGPWLMRRLGLL